MLAITCPGCRAENRAGRRYCGKCGCNFDPACQACGFGNDHDDRFCGGCGVGLVAGAMGAAMPAAATGPMTRPVTGPMAVVAHAAFTTGAMPRASTAQIPTAQAWPVDELAGLFARAPVVEEGPQLPETGVAQDDLDRLFGGGP